MVAMQSITLKIPRARDSPKEVQPDMGGEHEIPPIPPFRIRRGDEYGQYTSKGNREKDSYGPQEV